LYACGTFGAPAVATADTYALSLHDALPIFIGPDHIRYRTCTRAHSPGTGQSDGHRHGDGSLRPAGTDNVRAVLEKSDEERRNCVHVGRADHSCHLADCRTPIRSAPDFYRTACVHTDTARCDINHT